MAVKEEIVAFLRKTFANEKYPGRFRLDFICQGDRQFEKVRRLAPKDLKIY